MWVKASDFLPLTNRSYLVRGYVDIFWYEDVDPYERVEVEEIVAWFDGYNWANEFDQMLVVVEVRP
jgi:hypothetical protein